MKPKQKKSGLVEGELENNSQNDNIIIDEMNYNQLGNFLENYNNQFDTKSEKFKLHEK